MAELTTSSITSTVFGNMRIVMGKVASVVNSSNYFDTGLEYVFYCGVFSEDAGVAVWVHLNSTNGTSANSNGNVFAQLSAGTEDCRFIAIGK